MAHYFSQVKVETSDYATLGEYTNYRLHVVLFRHSGKSGISHFFNQSFYDDKTYQDYFHFHVYDEMDTSKTEIPKQDYKASFFQTYSRLNKTGSIEVPTLFEESVGNGNYAHKIFTSTEITTRKKKLFSAIYSGVNGNSSDVDEEDGWYYRGRGAIQLTGKELYEKVSDKCNDMFDTNYSWEVRANCDQLQTDKKCAIYSSVAYFEYRLTDVRKKGGISFLDNATVRSVTYEVNGGDNHLTERTNAYNSYFNSSNGIFRNCFHKVK